MARTSHTTHHTHHSYEKRVFPRIYGIYFLLASIFFVTVAGTGTTYNTTQASVERIKSYASDSHEPRTISVCHDDASTGSCTYTGGQNIQTAINNAQQGDTIIIKKGRYEIDKPLCIGENPKDTTCKSAKQLTIQGQKGAILSAHPTIPNVIEIGNNGGNLTISHMTFETSGSQVAIKSFITTQKGEEDHTPSSVYHVHVAHSTIKHGALVFSGYTKATLTNNKITRGTVSAHDNSTVIMRNNILTGGAQSRIFNGIIARDNSTMLLLNSIVHKTFHGIWCRDDSLCTIINTIAIENKESDLGLNTLANGNRIEYNLFGTIKNYNITSGNPNPSTTQIIGGEELVLSKNDREPRIERGNIVMSRPSEKYIDVRPTDVFTNASNEDFTLQLDSVAEDAGDPAMKDPDGSRSDMGIYGGQYACLVNDTLKGCVTNQSSSINDPTPSLVRQDTDTSITHAPLRIKQKPFEVK